MSSIATGEPKDDLMFIFIGSRGLQIGKIFFTLIKEDFKGKRYNILNFFSKVFFICESERQFREIGSMISGYIPEENILLMGELETEGDLWSNIEENDDIFANRIFAPLMFAVDQLQKPKILLFYDLSNGKQAGICDYLLVNFPLIKRYMSIYLVATTSIDEGAGALSIYWSILGLNSILQAPTVKACILLDFEAIGNSIYLKRIKKFSEIEFESYNYVVAYLMYALTHYDRIPYSNCVPFCQMIDKLVLFNDMKFIIPFMTIPRRELIEDETFSGYLNELVNDSNLFSIRYKKSKDEDENDIPKLGLANAFIAFGQRQDTDYLNLIRNNLPPIIEFLPGTATFYTYPLGNPISIFLENNTVVRQYFQDLIEKFDILISHHSYLHVLEELGITKDSFSDALDKLVSLIDAYQECEDLLYDDTDFDYETEIEKYVDKREDEDLEDYPNKVVIEEIKENKEIEEIEETVIENSDKLDKKEIVQDESIEKEKAIKNEIKTIKDKIRKVSKLTDETTMKPTTFDATSIMNMNEQSIKHSTKTIDKKQRSPSSNQLRSIVVRSGDQMRKDDDGDDEAGALKWLERRANKEKKKVKEEKKELEEKRIKFEEERKKFEEDQEKMDAERERIEEEERIKMKKKKDELKDIARMFETA